MGEIGTQAQVLLKVFLAACIGFIITGGLDITNMTSWANWKPVVAAGIGACLVWAYDYLNPTDERFGTGA